MTDRAVSETLGFVLVFALVTATIGLVYAAGIGGLQDAQDAEKVNNVQRAFDVLDDNLEDLHRSGTPSRATEVKLAEGTLRTGDPVEVSVHAVAVGNPANNATYSVSFEPIIYEDDSGEMLLYSGGAVLRSSGEGAVMLSAPNWINGSHRSVIPIINTYGEGGNIGGEGAVLIVAQRKSKRLHGPFEAAGTARVNVTVRSPRAAAWGRFMAERGFTPVDPDADHQNVTYQFETETLYVPQTGVAVSFNR